MTNMADPIIVPVVIPELDDTAESLSPVASPTAPRSKIRWTLDGEHDDLDAGKEMLNSEGCWSQSKRTSSMEGDKIYYRCNRVKKRGLQCAAAVYLLLDAFSAQVRVFRTDVEHNCDQSENRPTPSLSTEMKSIIEAMCDRKCKPLEIMDNLSLLNLPLPRMYTLKNYMAAYKKIKFGSPTISTSELQSLLHPFTSASSEPGAPYVVHDISPDAEHFRFFMTSKELINNARVAVSLSADATYKLLWQGFPVLVVGTTDLNKKFHMIGVAVTTNEKEEDFLFMFNAVSKCAVDLLNAVVKPTTLVSDGAKAIRNAFKKVYGDDTTIIMCWAHMLKNVRKQVDARVRDKRAREEIISDITFMQVLASPSQFGAAMDLFLRKWAAEDAFIGYFKDLWIDQNPLWYEGAKMRVPSTNNALEATNKVIKDKFTLRERLSLGEFVSVLVKMVGQYSRRCATDLVFAHAPDISKSLWTATYTWTKQKGRTMTSFETDGKIVVPIKSSTYNDAVPTVMSNWQTLQDFETFYKSVWNISLDRDDEWLNATCTCPSFLKEFMCKHVLGVAVRMGQTTVPNDAKTVAIGTKRKRGRPSKAKKAYIVQ